jgi:hypothetical protein
MFFPVMDTPLPVSRFADVEDRIVAKRPESCTGFSSTEAYEIQLPGNLTLLSMPEPAKVRGSMLDYTASYQQKGSIVLVQREVHDKTFQGICPSEVMRDFYKQAQPVGDNLRTQVLYKRRTTS